MWTKLSSALKSKQAQDGAALEQPTAGPSTSPSKSTVRKVFHRDDGSLRLNSPLKVSIPKKVKSTFNLHGNSSQLTLTPETLPGSSSDLSRRASQEVLSTSRPKATRRSSFNILITRRPSIDALRSPPETPRSMSRREESPNSNPTRNRAATFGGSVRSILREANTPGTGKSVRFYSRDAYDVAAPEQSQETNYRPFISRSTPPEETFLQHLQRSDSGDSSNASSAMPRFASSSRYSRPTVAEVFSPSSSTADSPHSRPRGQAPHLTNFFGGLDVPPIASLSVGVHRDLPDALSSTSLRDGGNGSTISRETGLKERPIQIDANPLGKDKAPRLPSVSHDRSTSFSFGQTVFYSMEHSDSKRSSSGKSSLVSDIDSDRTSDRTSASSSSSSPSLGRNRSLNDTVFMSMMRGTPPKVMDGANGEPLSGKEGSVAPEPDPFSAHATTYYTPQTMIPTTPPQTVSHHVRQASKEESIIFSLQTQLDMQSELCGQLEADLRARDEFVEVLGKKLVEAEEEDAKKRKFLRAWKKKVGELERTCRFLEDEVEGSRQESTERSIMDEASSEALQMLHRQISGLEREREGWKRTEVVLREELRRLETLAGQRRNEAVKLRESLGSLSEKEGKQKEQEQTIEVAMQQRSEEENQRHKAIETAWHVEKDGMLSAMDNIKLSNIGLVTELDDFKQQLGARDDEIVALKAELFAARDCAERTVASLEATEAGKCALAMERDSLKLQVIKLQEKTAAAEDDLQGLWDIRESLEKEREHLKDRIREEEGRFDAVNHKLKASENRVIELAQERQYAIDNVSRLEDNIRRRDIEAAEDSQRNFNRATDIEELREQMSRMRREQSVELEAALQDGARKQMEIEAQARALLESKTEISRLECQTRELQQESADKEVHIVQITKQRAQDKQDLEGLNIALDSKQQELELLKRRLGVRGIAGNTPPQSSKNVHQRRDSLAHATPRTSRPSSLASESGADPARERKPSVDRERKFSDTKIPALSKSARLNTSASILPTPVKATRGSMGPPPLRPRSSIVGTPTITPRTLTRSSSLASTPAGVKAKVSKAATTANPVSPPVEQGEKENADVSSSRRLSRIPTLTQ